ncbi:MAG: efflux transporter outer membrane subunit [Planctomycetes bacterium]|nr:efflux transporter outer membrane subunit [Planctomycetota bacterium]
MNRSRTSVQVLLAAAALSGALVGCKVGPDYKEPVAPAKSGEFASLSGDDVAKANAELKPSAARPLAIGELSKWWQKFNDPALDSLIERAVAGNNDLKIAAARVREARALRGIEESNLFPKVDATGSYRRSRDSENSPRSDPGSTDAHDLFQAGLDAAWEIDVFGGIRRSIEAADADLAAAEETRRDVLITVIAEVARNYVELRSFQRRVEVNQEAIRSQGETLELTKSLANAGISSQLQVEQARAQLAARESQLPPLRVGVRQSAYRLAVLLGQEPGSLLAELGAPSAIPVSPTDVPVGLPSELLRRRPDIRRSERQIAAASARVGVETAELFPKFSITGDFGFEARDIGNLFDANSRVWGIGPSMRWNIFSAGKVRNRIRAAGAREEASVAEYERTVLLALEEVENSLTLFVQEQARRRSLAAAEQASSQALNLATERYKSGIGDFLNVLDAQRALYELQDQLVNSGAEVSRSLIALYKALGGGWDESVLLPPETAEKPADSETEPQEQPEAPKS